jgi:glycosyltransferase involved in cell wall biosynthesis
VVLSYYYALPNKLIEYVQAGLPVIASDLPEIRSIMQTFNIGWKANDVSELITVLDHFETLKNDKNLKEGLKKAAQVLNWHNEKNRLLEIYARIL